MLRNLFHERRDTPMSCKYLYFTEKDLPQRWNEVKSEDEFWSSLSYRVKRMTKELLGGARFGAIFPPAGQNIEPISWSR